MKQISNALITIAGAILVSGSLRSPRAGESEFIFLVGFIVVLVGLVKWGKEEFINDHSEEKNDLPT